MVLFDSGAFIALMIGDDGHHADAASCVRQLVAQRLPVAVAAPTIYESHRRILQLAGRSTARTFLEILGTGEMEVIHAGRDEYDGAVRILDAHPYLALTLTDAVSVAIMLARGIGSIFSFDDDFLQVGLLRVPPL
ncbi:MAG TPA: PIN domain-containing protein [Candidatus Dormibacteraeota bacterium]|nr:PIN domain-containing protein [Candidatus Dormibacteraeota bacterium]